MNKLSKFLNAETLRYVIIGAMTSVVNFAAFTVLRYLNVGLNFSNFIAITLSILFAFFTNKYFVFKSKTDSVKGYLKEFWGFIFARLFAMAVEIFGVWFLVEILSANEYVSKLFIQVIVIVLNYVSSKFLVFKNKE